MPQPDKYGRYYWCVRLFEKHGDPSRDEKPVEIEVYANADRIEINDGNLILHGAYTGDPENKAPEQITLAFARGEWRYVYAASVMDGHAVSVDHWPGQIVE